MKKKNCNFLTRNFIFEEHRLMLKKKLQFDLISKRVIIKKNMDMLNICLNWKASVTHFSRQGETAIDPTNYLHVQ